MLKFLARLFGLKKRHLAAPIEDAHALLNDMKNKSKGK